MENLSDGTYKVCYEPTEAGPTSVLVKLDGKEVPQSPIEVDVAPGPDLNKVKLQEFETEVFVDCPNEFVVDCNGFQTPNEEARKGIHQNIVLLNHKEIKIQNTF
jgi:hypothetical protein